MLNGTESANLIVQNVCVDLKAVFFPQFAVNFAVENLVQLVKPIVGHLLERVQIFGSVKSKWLPVLAQRFPEDTLPFQYGGARKHKYVFTYG